tara:strand:- start:602 stop:841 length:240 start_codon:yes stop_codon:yes gene_type:complete
MRKEPTKERSKDLRQVRLVKDEQITELFGISKSCLYRWRKRGEIPFMKIGSTNFYLEDVILKMLYMRGGKLPDEREEKL